MAKLRCACYPGSGYETVREILLDLGMTPVEILDLRTAHRASFDRLLLLGGQDIHPMWYEEPVTAARGLCIERDLIEITMLTRAHKGNIPVFGICRGHQLLNVFYGGKLWQDLRLEKRSKFSHTSSYHDLTNLEGFFAQRLPSYYVNSYHHQAIRKVGSGLKVVARSRDGVVEAIWGYRKLGVQFHPEFMYPIEPGWDRLFRWFRSGLRGPKNLV